MNLHPFRGDALFFGVLFTLVLVGWAAMTFDLVHYDDLVVAGLIALILAGVAGIVLSLRRKS